MLTVVCWLWGNGYTGHGWRAVYTAERVNAFARMFRAHCTLPHRIVCITDMPEGVTECETYPLWHEWRNLRLNAPGMPGHVPNCYRRLRLFDERFTACELRAEGLVLHCDLDCAFLQNIDDLLTLPAHCGLRIVRGLRTTRYNGSMYLIQPGAYQRLWDDFDPEHSPAELRAVRNADGRKLVGSDQAWISHKVDNAATFSSTDGVYQLGQWSRTEPARREHARMVFFAGGFKPWHKQICRKPHNAQQLYDAYRTHSQVAREQAA